MVCAGDPFHHGLLGAAIGPQTIVFGYIELPLSSAESYGEVLEGFDFDRVYPLRDVFSSPEIGYRSAMASFADSVKAEPSEWLEWTQRFEELLLELDALSAKVCLECDGSNEGTCFSYLRSDGGWLRWQFALECAAMGEEVVLPATLSESDQSGSGQSKE